METAYRHNGLNFLTPHQRHTGMEQIILEKRKQLYEEAKTAHPECWSRDNRNM